MAYIGHHNYKLGYRQIPRLGFFDRAPFYLWLHPGRFPLGGLGGLAGCQPSLARSTALSPFQPMPLLWRPVFQTGLGTVSGSRTLRCPKATGGRSRTASRFGLPGASSS